MTKQAARQGWVRGIIEARCGGKIADFAKAIGRDASYVSRMLYPPGKSGAKGIGDDMMAAIATAFPGMQPPPEAIPAFIVHPVRSSPDDAPPAEGEHHIETLSFQMSAGTGKIVPVVIETHSPITYRDRWFKTNRVKPESVKRVRIDGDSMEPTLYDGDYAIINLDDNERVIDGRVYALIFGSDRWGRVKRLYRTAAGYRIVSDNSDKERFPDEIVEGDAADDIRIIGRVIDKSGRGGL